jgi:hypothetical protein
MSQDQAPASDKGPVDRIRIGSIEASIWANYVEGGTKPFYTVSLQRTYKDKASGDLHNTTSVGVEDLPLVEKVAAKALDRILEIQGDQQRGRGR